MWALYFLLSKILNVEEAADEKVNGSDGDHVNARECQDAILAGSHFVEVPHISQLHSWDCGLACVLMTLNTIGINNCSIQTLEELCCTTRFSYFTVTLGANPNYSAETFYKEQLPTDLVRVDMLFQEAREKGITIQCRSINVKEIALLILSGRYIAIALVDQYILSRSWMEDVIFSGLNRSNSSYTGHYVVICGYDASADEFEIRDPASSRISERISSKCLEEARKSYGTDEDLLLISLEKSSEQNSSSLQHSPHVDVSLHCT
ncbi:guanylyl cyclase 1 isoform X2 [Mercurialis annua]|uniref:guanylyl cyclase 1 isoform X2 n=1 Tax=Mercurialis annua TaxID=3986 RepID=UPI00215E1F1A|nr:guanylyl cyclase 1 isoform X2 [Mercurialis annua]